MDRKSIIVLVVCFLVMVLWYPLVVNKLYPPKPLPAGVTNGVSALPTPTNAAPTAPPPSLAESPAQTPKPFISPTAKEELLEITNAQAHYTFTTHGGGLKEVQLIQYPETTSTRRDKQDRTNRVATLNSFAPAPTLALLDGEAVQGDGVYNLTRTATGVRAEKQLTNGLTIVKDFHLSTNYLMVANVRLENRSNQPLTLPAQHWVVGTATSLDPRDASQVVGMLWYNGNKSEDVGEAWFANRTLGCIPGTPRVEYRGGASNVVWVAVHNQFFALAAMPQQPAQGVAAWKIHLPRPTGAGAPLAATNAPPPQGYEAALVYPALTLAPNQSLERQIHLFAGPKEYQTLARIGDRFNNNIDQVMGYGGFFGFFAKSLLLTMNWFHSAMKLPYGWAIVAITILVKLLFWPLTQISTRSSKRMAALQPHIKVIQEKYKDDPVKVQRKMMELWKEHKVSPMSGCLPMLIQIPVFFGFYKMIQSAIELRGANWLWVGDLSKPDTLFMVPGLGFIPFIGTPEGLPFNLLPLIMGVTMLWQARLTPPAPGMDPMQAKIMRYMPVMFMVFLYNFSAGLTLYWTVQNLLTILQTKLTRTTEETPAPAKPVLTAPQKKRK